VPPPDYDTSVRFAAASLCNRSGVADFISDVFDADRPCVDGVSGGSTLSTTVEHYSLSAAALNDTASDIGHPRCHHSGATELTSDHPGSNLTDTNALFHELLRTNLILDELDYDNYTFLERSKLMPSMQAYCRLVV